MEFNVREHLLKDRQWKREHRLAFAKSMLAHAITKQEINFWQSIIDANELD